MPPTTTTSNNSLDKVRIELFFKDKAELKQRVEFLSQKGITGFNLVNKNTQDTLGEWVDAICQVIPNNNASVCVHYSAKYNKSRKVNGAFEKFKNFLHEMDAKPAPSGTTNNHDVLLISGSSGDIKPKFNSLSGLQQLTGDDIRTRIAVAFNPFFPAEADLEKEKARLQAKLATKRVHKVYLQFGTDLQRLRYALEWLNKAQASADDDSCQSFEICGSIFLPTKKLIAQQKFRPWNGVWLSEEFLDSPKGARAIVLEMMRIYDEANAEILIEAPGVRNEKDFALVEELLQERDEISGANTSGDYSDTDMSRRRGDSTKSHASKKRKMDRTISLSPSVTQEQLHKAAIVVFGSHDVRIHDNVAFQLASCHSSVIPVFVWSKAEQGGKWGTRGALEVVLKDALRNLNTKLRASNLRLVCRSTKDYTQELKTLCQETNNAATVYWNTEHTPESHLREAKTKSALAQIGVQVVECQSSLLYDPKQLNLSNGFNGGHWGTLMPFLKACRKQLGEPRNPIPRHETFALLERNAQPPKAWPPSTPIDELDLAVIQGENRWDEPILERFPASEEEAWNTLNNFFAKGLDRYETERSRADLDHSTSKLSMHLRLGTLSPNELYHKVDESDLDYNQMKTFSRRLFWRDLAYFQLLHFPKMRESSVRAHYDQTKWTCGQTEQERFHAWKTGTTGYPLVDAGMRELYSTGWMTQSIRMVVASFLTEYLRVNWVKGCEWFHYTLVDADSAINAMMWQNAGRSGIDQWNFVMSPVAASQDATGEYTRKWVPELSKLSKPLLHRPWEAPAEILEQAGIVLGETYPHRIVEDLAMERELTVRNVLQMRHANQKWNDKRGYDLVTLPNKMQTVVFTKKEFRIDRDGNVIKMDPRRKKSQKGKASKAARGRRGRQKKAVS